MANCPICNGSGEKDQATLSGYMTLDCDAPNCTAATERAALEAANKAAEPMTVYDQRWFAYGMGKANPNFDFGATIPFDERMLWQRVLRNELAIIIGCQDGRTGQEKADAVLKWIEAHQ